MKEKQEEEEKPEEEDTDNEDSDDDEEESDEETEEDSKKLKELKDMLFKFKKGKGNDSVSEEESIERTEHFLKCAKAHAKGL